MNKLPIVRREKDTITAGDCAVCGTRTLEFHFGAVCCVACGAFFRRSISDGKKFICKLNDSCKIISGSRSSCRSCRLQRCLDAGMDPRAVQSAGSSSLKSRESSTGISPSISPSSTQSIPEKENIIKTFEFHYSAIAQARKLIYGTGTVQDLIQGVELKPRQCHLFDRVDTPVLRVEQSLAIMMLKKLKMFNDLPKDDQLPVLRSFCLNLSIIEKYYFTFKMGGVDKGHLYFSNTWYTDCYDINIAPPEFVRQLQPPSYGTLFLQPQLSAIQKLSVPMREISMDHTDLVGLLLWDLFDPETPSVAEETTKILIKYREAIKRDWIELYNAREVADPEGRFNAMADLHHVVRQVAIAYREDFAVFRFFNLLDYDALIDDILDLPAEFRFNRTYKTFGAHDAIR